MVLVSVVIPLYNKKNYIGRAIRSVLMQTIEDFEIIIIDDGSIDGSSDVVKTFLDSRIRLISQENQGVSVARNNGVRNSRSDFITFLDADDEWLPNHLKTLLRLRNEYPFAGAFTTAYKIFEPNGKIRSARYQAIPKNPKEGLIPNYFKSASLGDSPMNSSSIGIPKIIFNELIGFPEGVWWGEDMDLFGKIALKYPIAFSWEFGAIYHWDVSSRVCGIPSFEPEPFVKTAQNILRKEPLPESIRKDLKEYIARKELYRAASYLYVGAKAKTREILGMIETDYFKMRKILLFSLSFMPQFIIRSVLGRFFIDPC
jgi:glycosyltransferase involved in cell wall biosynthesis